jgi:hypothetical protein
MEALTRLVSDSLARHGLDRPVDPRRLQWSRWFRCDSPHSLLVVPSKPGIFALAEEIVTLSSISAHVGTAALGCPVERSSAVEERRFSAASSELNDAQALAAEPRRMLAVIQFSEDENMAFVLDRMFTWVNPMRSRLHSGNCFVRFVVIEDHDQRRSICAVLNQWMRNSAEKATGLPAEFSSSLELSLENVARAPSPAMRSADPELDAASPKRAQLFAESQLDSGSNKNLHCPPPFPSGF